MSHTLASVDGLTARDVRQRIIDSATAALGWQLSRHAWDDFPGSPDSRHLEHLGFAVGLLTTEPIQLERQRRTVGTVCNTEVGVRLGFRLRADAVSADYNAALDAEADMLAQLRDTSRDPELDVRLGRVSRRVEDLFFVADINCYVMHRIPLS